VLDGTARPALGRVAVAGSARKPGAYWVRDRVVEHVLGGVELVDKVEGGERGLVVADQFVCLREQRLGCSP
jgi:hypothetical protein